MTILQPSLRRYSRLEAAYVMNQISGAEHSMNGWLAWLSCTMAAPWRPASPLPVLLMCVAFCVQALMHTKAKYLVSQLQVLGFVDWQCAMAVMQHGSNLEACIAFLLEDHLLSEDQCKQYMASHALTPPIDLSEELSMLTDAQVRLIE